MNRSGMLSQLYEHANRPWDVIVIGGGATGAGIALDAATRGFDTLLLEQEDFGKGTSGRSTKLLHGGVRYLAQGDLGLVFEALRERGIILNNAPHLTANQEFVVPAYSIGDVLKYTAGLKFYDLLAGKRSLGKSRFITKAETLKKIPTLNHKGLRGGILYHDGQFDDTRLLMALIHSLVQHGGMALNYCGVTALVKNGDQQVCGVQATEKISGKVFHLQARTVVNATGVFADEVLKMDNPVMKRTIRPSQGVHLVIDATFLPGHTAMMIPKTDDGRVLFAIPWHNKVVLGTTDTPVEQAVLEPRPLQEEIDFILRTAGAYLTRKPEPRHVLSVFAGLRPLVASPDNPSNTRELSRRHKISISASRLVTVEGGKWTIYRQMAEDTLNRMMQQGMLEKRPCLTRQLKLYGNGSETNDSNGYPLHSDIAGNLKNQPGEGEQLHQRLPYTRDEITWICQNEMPVKLEDVLARRTRALLLDAPASKEIAPEVAAIMAAELHMPAGWEKSETAAYSMLAEKYLCR